MKKETQNTLNGEARHQPKEVEQAKAKPKSKRKFRSKSQAKPAPQSNDYPLIAENDKGQPYLIPHSKASRVLKDEINTLAFDPVTENWLSYKKNSWNKITKAEQKSGIDSYIHKLGGIIIGYSDSYVNGVNNLLKGILIKQFDKEQYKNRLPFKNGVLDLNNKILLPHDPNHLFTWQLPYDYQESSDCRSFTEFLSQSVYPNNDQIIVLQAFINAVITGRSDLQKYLELIGFGGTGKSVLIAVLVALVGSKNCHSTTLKILAKDKFETANLYQKRLLIITDAEKWAGDIAQFKAITGQDPIRYEVKFQQAQESFVYQGMVMLAANHHIDTNDNSSGIQRRRITMLFNNVVQKNFIDTNLAQELTKLAPQIINWALKLPSEKVTDILLNPIRYAPSLEEQEQETLEATNPIAAWATDNLEQAPDHKTQIGKLIIITVRQGGRDYSESRQHFDHEDEWLYPNFAQWFNQNNHNDRYSKRISNREFKQTIIDILRNVLKWGNIEEVKPNNKVHIKGVRIKEREET